MLSVESRDTNYSDKISELVQQIANAKLTDDLDNNNKLTVQVVHKQRSRSKEQSVMVIIL